MDHADHRCERTALPEHVHPEAPQLGDGERKVVVQPAVKIGTVAAGDLIDLLHQLADLSRLQKTIGKALLPAAAFEGDRQAGDEENIRRLEGNCLFQDLQYCHCSLLIRRRTRPRH